MLDALELTLASTYLPRQAKTPFLQHMSNKVDLLKYLIRLAHETKSMNTKRYAALEQQVVEMGRMIGGWMKSMS